MPSCAECKEWLYDPGNGWKIAERGGERLKRPAHAGLPCRSCPKGSSDGKPHPEKELGPEGRASLEWYYLCVADAAERHIPRDGVTIRNNALLSRLIEQIDRSRADLTPVLMAAMFGGGKATPKGRQR